MKHRATFGTTTHSDPEFDLGMGGSSRTHQPMEMDTPIPASHNEVGGDDLVPGRVQSIAPTATYWDKPTSQRPHPREMCGVCQGEGETVSNDGLVERCRVCRGSGKLSRRARKMRRFAHDSGDGARIFHCFAGETRFWTHEGLMRLDEAVNTTQRVLTKGGRWVEAEIHEFGEQELMKITLRRNKHHKTIYATAGHRWLLHRGRSGWVTTDELRPGDRLEYQKPFPVAASHSRPSPQGIAHGIVFGDGTRAARGSIVRLWGEKDAQLLRFFSENQTYVEKTVNGVLGQRVVDLPAYYKDRPSPDESISYLYGWLAGYFAADGSVDRSGRVVLTCASRETLEFVEWIATTRLGITCSGIYQKDRVGLGSDETPIYSLSFVGSTLSPEFFLVTEHRLAFEDAQERKAYERIGWTVESVEASDRLETVYCAVVPETETFVLEGMILTGNCPFCGSGAVTARSDASVECAYCKATFTVQAQPQHPYMPQTVNGQPFEAPAMPGDPSVPGEGPAGPVQPGQDPAPPGTPEGLPGPQEGSSGPAPGHPEADLMAQLGAESMLVTHEGLALPLDEFTRHLALKHAMDREAVLREVRAGRR